MLKEFALALATVIILLLIATRVRKTYRMIKKAKVIKSAVDIGLTFGKSLSEGKKGKGIKVTKPKINALREQIKAKIINVK